MGRANYRDLVSKLNEPLFAIDERQTDGEWLLDVTSLSFGRFQNEVVGYSYSEMLKGASGQR